MFSQFYFQIVHSKYIEIQLILVNWSCNLKSDQLVTSNSFLVHSLGFVIHKIMPWANRDILTSFSIWVSFILFSCLTDLPWTCSTMLNRSGKSRLFFLLIFLISKGMREIMTNVIALYVGDQCVHMWEYDTQLAWGI